jgi:zinc protease
MNDKTSADAAPSNSPQHRRQLVKLLAVFVAIVFALSALYLKKPQREGAASDTGSAHTPASTPATPPRLLDSEILIAQKAPRKQQIDIQSWTTPKGARVLFVQAPEVPMLDVRLVFNAGGARDGDKPGVASLTNSLLDEGTGPNTVDDIARHFEGLGASVTLGSYRDMAIASLRTLSDPAYRDRALPMFYNVVAKPSFPEASFERNRKQMLIGLEAEKQSPAAILGREFFARLYNGHPYGTPPNGTEASLTGLTLRDVRAFHRRWYVASNLVIAMTGAIDRATAESITNALDAVLARGEPAPALPQPVAASETSRAQVDFPSSQTHLMVGGLSIQRDSPDWPALYVGNEILGGGGFTSRLNQIIRQDNGLAYSVYSGVSPMGRAGPFMMNLQTRNDNAAKALALVQQTFDAFVKDGPTAQEVEDARRNLLGGWPLATANNRAIVDQLGAMAFYDLPLDYLERMPEKIAAVTAEDIRKAFAANIANRPLLTVTVGQP